MPCRGHQRKSRDGSGLLRARERFTTIPRELTRAIDCDIPIVPVRDRKSVQPRGSLEYSLSNVHWMDAIDGSFEEHTRHLSSTLRPSVSLRRRRWRAARPTNRISASGRWKPPRTAEPAVESTPVAHVRPSPQRRHRDHPLPLELAAPRAEPETIELPAIVARFTDDESRIERIRRNRARDARPPASSSSSPYEDLAIWRTHSGCVLPSPTSFGPTRCWRMISDRGQKPHVRGRHRLRQHRGPDVRQPGGSLSIGLLNSVSALLGVSDVAAVEFPPVQRRRRARARVEVPTRDLQVG